MTTYTYDCEFLEDGSTIDLISIGICADDGREYYAVNSDMDEKRLKHDDWMCANVIPHLPLRGKVERHSGNGGYYWSLDMRDAHVKPKWVIANEVRDFLLAGDGKPELWAYYGAYDHVALCRLWGKMISLPAGIPMWTHDIMQLLEHADGMPEIPQQDEHHALADARWSMAVLQTLGITSAMKNTGLLP